MPTTLVTLELAHDLNEDTFRAAAVDAVRTRIAELMELLGIPGDVAVTAGSEDVPLVRLTINGQVCRYAEELLARLYCYAVAETPFHFRRGDDRAHAWLRQAEPHRAAGFVAELCAEAAKCQPEVLLGPDEAAEYVAALPAAGEDRDAVVAALRRVLSLRVSLADRDTAVRTIAAGLEARRGADELAEDLVEALAPAHIEIRMPLDYLREITLHSDAQGRDNFVMMREGLFYELGLHYTDMRFVPDETLAPSSFAFRLNHLTTVPGRGLASSQVLTNDTPERLRLLNLEAAEAVNPANLRDAAVLKASDGAAAEQAGCTTWDALGYAILCLSCELRDWGSCLVRRSLVGAMLDKLGRFFPDLVRAVRQAYTPEQLTGMARHLASEQVSVRNLPRILNLLLDYDYIVADPRRQIVFDDRLAVEAAPDSEWLEDPLQLAAFVRTGLKRQLSHQHSRGSSTLAVYLLDPEIETAIAAQREQVGEELVRAICDELARLPRATDVPVILTAGNVRPAARRLIAHEFPRLHVLAYAELDPALNIQPIARISWG